MRQVINLGHLAGSGGAALPPLLSGPSSRTLAVAASHPHVVTGASSSGMAGGPGMRDEVCVRVFA